MVDTRAHTSGIDVGVFVTTVLEDIGDNGDNNINGSNFLLNIPGHLWLYWTQMDVAKMYNQ